MWRGWRRVLIALASVVCLVVLLAGCGPTPTPTSTPSEVRPQLTPSLDSPHDLMGPDRDCADFATQREAQRFYERSLDVFGYDRHRLDGDGDGDGVACEWSR